MGVPRSIDFTLLLAIGVLICRSWDADVDSESDAAGEFVGEDDAMLSFFKKIENKF